MKHLGITYGMERRSDISGAEESVESYIELPITDEKAKKILNGERSNELRRAIDQICVLQGYYICGIKKIEEVTLSG